MVLIFVIGVLNLSLGYALAVRLGYGPPSLLDAWEVLLADFPTVRGRTPAPVVKNELFPEEVSQSIEDMLDETDSELFGDTDDELFEESVPESFGEEEDNQPEEEPGPNIPEIWDLNEKFVETSILKLNVVMLKSGARATEIDTKLRKIRGKSDATTIKKCLDKLKEDCETFLAEQSEAADKFHERIGELGEFSDLGAEIETANLEQAAQIETTLSNLQFMDFDSDLESANQRLLEELNNLRVARHKLRDDQERAFLAIARSEQRMANIEKQLLDDPLTLLPNRIGLETTLWSWWQEGRHQSRQMSAALLDLDHFGKLNEVHGSKVGDRVLFELARLIQDACNEADLVARFSGQRFLVMFVDVGPRAAIKNTETIRQSIERITFHCNDEENKSFNLTVSGGITEVNPKDTDKTFVVRLEESLEQAKKAGRNQSFFHDGGEPEFVESPSFGVEYTDISI